MLNDIGSREDSAPLRRPGDYTRRRNKIAPGCRKALCGRSGCAPVVDVPLCRVEELPDGAMRHFEHIGYDLLLAHLDGRFYCVDAACTHGWADLSQGSIDRAARGVTCPGCGGLFSLETGQPLAGPPQFPLQVYDVHVVGDEVVVTFVY